MPEKSSLPSLALPTSKLQQHPKALMEYVWSLGLWSSPQKPPPQQERDWVPHQGAVHFSSEARNLGETDKKFTENSLKRQFFLYLIFILNASLFVTCLGCFSFCFFPHFKKLSEKRLRMPKPWIFQISSRKQFTHVGFKKAPDKSIVNDFKPHVVFKMKGAPQKC